MEVIPQHAADMEKIAERILGGEVMVYPTETCYGLGCDATNAGAVDRIFAIKERQKDKPLLVVVSDIDMLIEYIHWSPKLDEIAHKFWPGALTAVVPLHPGHPFPPGVVGPGNTLAFRVSAYPLVHEIAEAVGRPLVSTSANIASLGSPYDPESIHIMFDTKQNRPDFMIDAGALSHESPSTVVKIDGGRVHILRQGEVIVPREWLV